MKPVAGRKDPLMLRLSALHCEAGRLKHGSYFIEGAELVRRAVDFGAEIEAVVLTTGFAKTDEGAHLLDKTEGAGARAYSASAGLLSSVLGAKPIPHCLAVVARRTISLAEAAGSPNTLVQMVESGESADNLGMLLRTADAAGVDSVVLAADTIEPFNRRTVRGSRGAVFTLPICIAEDPLAAIKRARESGLKVVATSVRGEKDYAAVDYTKPVMLVVGNEHRGISRAVRENADVVAGIPMLGRVPSLNIAVAASIMLYEAVRQRRRA